MRLILRRFTLRLQTKMAMSCRMQHDDDHHAHAQGCRGSREGGSRVKTLLLIQSKISTQMVMRWTQCLTWEQIPWVGPQKEQIKNWACEPLSAVLQVADLHPHARSGSPEGHCPNASNTLPSCTFQLSVLTYHLRKLPTSKAWYSSNSTIQNENGYSSISLSPLC